MVRERERERERGRNSGEATLAFEPSELFAKGSSVNLFYQNALLTFMSYREEIVISSQNL